MTRMLFFLKTSMKNLLHGGQRMVVALLCIAFGVMSLVSMAMISSTLKNFIVEVPQDLIGADISMDRSSGDAILPEDIVGLDELCSQGILDQYTLVGYTSTLSFHLPDSGEMQFPSAGIGVDPQVYPPIGELTVESSSGLGLSALLNEVGDVVISRDLALEYNLSEGDTIILSELSSGMPLEAHVNGIVDDTPNHKGSKLYYSLETAEKLSGNNHSLNTVLATSSNPYIAQSSLKDLGWRVFLAQELADNDAALQNMFISLLNGAGVLGLLVSGIGIANTMQVLLRRRQREIAVWKSIGFTSNQLLFLFSIEAGLLGLLGSLLGAVLGIVVSNGLMDLFSRTSTMLVYWKITPEPILLSIFVGIVTTVIFALWPIVSNSRVSPVVLLRGESVSIAKLPWSQSLILLLILSLPFVAVISLIMGSLLKGIIILAIALAGLVGLGGIFGALLWLVTRLIPRHGLPLLNMARSNLKERGLAPVFALIALFVGVVSLTFSGVVTQNATKVLDDVAQDVTGNNLTILAPVEQSDEIVDVLDNLDIESGSVAYLSHVKSIVLEGEKHSYSSLLVARSDPSGYSLTGAPWGTKPNGAYVSAFYNIPIGSTLEVTGWDGSVHKIEVVGTYNSDSAQTFNIESEILLSMELGQSITTLDQIQYFIHVPANRLTVSSREVGKALPDATVINLVAYAARFTRQFKNLFVLAVSMASLAFLAGLLLMANSVSLNVLDRRFEMGVLKAMGYTFWHILGTLMIEYAIITLLAAVTGLVTVRGFLWLMSIQNPLAAILLVLTPQMAAIILLLSLGLTLIMILAVTWKSTRVPAMVVLSDRE